LPALFCSALCAHCALLLAMGQEVSVSKPPCEKQPCEKQPAGLQGLKVGNPFRRRDDRKRAWKRFLNWWRRSALRYSAGFDSSGAEPSHKLLEGSMREVYLRRLGIGRCGEACAAGMDSCRLTIPATSSRRESASSSGCESLVSSDTAFEENEQGHPRMKFLQKLSYERVWLPKPQRPRSHQTVIIFDWADTLLCTSFLRMMEGCVLAPRVEEQLQACERASGALLELALSLGQTFIITNALGGWVESSAKFWAPSLLPLLQRVRVVSARSRYEVEFPQEPMRWKAEAFSEVRRQLNAQAITNIVSLGDSEYEMAAGQAMAQGFRHASIKLIKFAETPGPRELSKELQLVLEEFEEIVGRARNVKVKLQRPQETPVRSRSLPHFL